MVTLPVSEAEAKEQTASSIRAVLNINLDLSEDILVRAARVAYETLDALMGEGLEPCNIVDTEAFSTLVEQYVKILSSGK